MRSMAEGTMSKRERSVGNYWHRASVGAAWFLRRFDFAMAIDRCFRFLEITIVTALISVPLEIVEPTVGFYVRLGLSILAGVYLAQPVAVWWMKRALRRIRRRDPSRIAPPRDAFGSQLMRLLMILSFGMATVVWTAQLQALIRSTIQLDEAAIRRHYEQRTMRDPVLECAARQGKAWPFGSLDACAPNPKNKTP